MFWSSICLLTDRVAFLISGDWRLFDRGAILWSEFLALFKLRPYIASHDMVINSDYCPTWCLCFLVVVFCCCSKCVSHILNFGFEYTWAKSACDLVLCVPRPQGNTQSLHCFWGLPCFWGMNCFWGLYCFPRDSVCEQLQQQISDLMLRLEDERLSHKQAKHKVSMAAVTTMLQTAAAVSAWCQQTEWAALVVCPGFFQCLGILKVERW